MQVTPAKKTSWSQYRALLGSPLCREVGSLTSRLLAARLATSRQVPQQRAH